LDKRKFLSVNKQEGYAKRHKYPFKKMYQFSFDFIYSSLNSSVSFLFVADLFYIPQSNFEKF